MNKYALITGAANGIGYEFARLLIQDSYNLVLVDVDEIKLGKKKEILLEKNETAVITIPKDLSLPGAAQELFDEVNNQNIEIDVLINNAGFGVFGLFSETCWDREHEMIQLHITNTVQLTKLFLKQMALRNSGKIMNVSSLAAFLPGPLMSVYYSTKAFLLSFSEAIANEVKNTNVTITVLCPGVTATGFQAGVGNGKPKLTRNAASAEKVAKYGYKAMQKGKVTVIPGRTNKFIIIIQRLLPRSVVCHVVRRVQEKNRSKQKAVFYEN